MTAFLTFELSAAIEISWTVRFLNFSLIIWYRVYQPAQSKLFRKGLDIFELGILRIKPGDSTTTKDRVVIPRAQK